MWFVLLFTGCYEGITPWDLFPHIRMIDNYKMDKLPNDPMMLFSFINTKLRDEYPSLDALCEDLQVDKHSLEECLKQVGFEYDPTLNKFW